MLTTKGILKLTQQQTAAREYRENLMRVLYTSNTHFLNETAAVSADGEYVWFITNELTSRVCQQTDIVRVDKV